MATPDDIENRLSAVERDVSELREQQRLTTTDATAARTLAAGADRDVSEVRAELRAHTSALNALRQTQLETLDRVARVETGLDGIDGRLGGVETGLDGIDGRLGGVDGRLDGLERTMTDGFATLGAGMTQIVTLLEGLPER